MVCDQPYCTLPTGHKGGCSSSPARTHGRAVSTDVEFHVFHDGDEWAATADGINEILATGKTPTSAIIGAEIALFKRAR